MTKLLRNTGPIGLLLAFVLLLGGCVEDTAEARFGVDIFGIVYEVDDPQEGVHPNNSVLANDNNPFRNNPLGIDERFEILGTGAAAATYYAWATQLAREPTGEAQFYTAVGLFRIYEAGAVADEDDRETTRLMAIAAAQSVLDNFPESVTFDATGTIASRLATPAYQLIVDLGGTPEGDWVLVQDPNGGVAAVRGSEPQEAP